MRIDAGALPEKTKSKKSRIERTKALAEHRGDLRRQRRRKSREREEQERADLVQQLQRSRSRDLADIRLHVFGAADFQGVKRQRLSDLLHMLVATSPRLLEPIHKTVFTRLVILPWRRRAQDWIPSSKGARSQIASLVMHLVGRYPVPRFLMDAFMAGERQGDLGFITPLFVALTEGRSILDCVRSGLISLPLTRRMGRIFLDSPSGAPLDWALTRAQVLGYDGDEKLARALLAARVPWLPDPDFEAEVVHWFCRQDPFDLVQLHPLVDYFRHRRQISPAFRLKGQTVPTSLKRMHDWHAELNRKRDEVDQSLVLPPPPPTIRPGSWMTKDDQGEPVAWTMTPIQTMGQLRAEGRKQRHCVASYARGIRNGNYSIWSLRRNGVRQVTIQVSGHGRILQARGPCNRLPKPQEIACLAWWARDNSLNGGSLRR